MMGDEVALDVTQRVGVDITGEQEGIRRLLLEAEELLARMGFGIRRRQRREGWASHHAGVPLTQSPRLGHMNTAQWYLDAAAKELLAAYLASGTMTDEIPF